MKERTTRGRAGVWLATAALVLGVLGVIVGAYSAVTAGNASEAAAAAKARAVVAEAKADTLLEARTASRIVACGTANDIAKKHNDLVDGVEETLRLATQTSVPRSPERQAQVDAFLKQQIARYESIKVALRDCSPAGIEAYYPPKEQP